MEKRKKDLSLSRANIIFISAICCVICSTGCVSTGYRYANSQPDYIKPESIDAAEWAVNDRIRQLERELADTREFNNRLIERLQKARDTARSIRESSGAIGELGRRSENVIRSVFEEIEILVVWIQWAVDRIVFLESLLEGEV